MKNKLTLLLSLVLLTACTHGTSSLKRVEIGMSKTDLFRVMGSPTTVSAAGGVEYITYKLHGEDEGFGRPQVTFRLVNGVVESYGKIQPAPAFVGPGGSQ